MTSEFSMADEFSAQKNFQIIFKIFTNSKNKFNKFSISSISRYPADKEVFVYPYFLFKIKKIKPIFSEYREKNKSEEKNAALITVDEVEQL